MSQSYIYPRYNKTTETIINPLSALGVTGLLSAKDVVTDTIEVKNALIVGNAADAADKSIHLQSKQKTLLFLEADTDNITETEHPEIIGTQDGGNVGFQISNIDDNSLNIDLIDIPGTNGVDFYINSTAATLVGTGAPPNIGVRTNLVRVNRDSSGMDVLVGGVSFPNAGAYLSVYDQASISGAWTGSAGNWGAGTVTVASDLERVGDTVTIIISQHIAALQNAGTIVSPAGYVPAAYRPTLSQAWPINVIDTVTNKTALLQLSTAGTFTVYGTDAAGNFTGATANAGWSFGICVSWKISNP